MGFIAAFVCRGPTDSISPLCRSKNYLHMEIDKYTKTPDALFPSGDLGGNRFNVSAVAVAHYTTLSSPGKNSPGGKGYYCLIVNDLGCYSQFVRLALHM